MIELDIKKFIEDEFEYPAFMERPQTAIDTFFVIEKISGSRDEQIDFARIAIQPYAPSMYQAASLCEQLNDEMLNNFVALPNITKVELNSSYNYTDTTTKKYRYQSIFEIYYYGGNANE